MRGTLKAFLPVMFLGAAMGEALACSCESPPRALTDDEYRAWKFERTTNVVRGRILDVHAGQDVLRGGQRFVVAKMKVELVVKGEVPLGDLTLVTGFGTGDCGIASALLVGIAWQRDFVLEVRRIPELSNEYWVGMCGYGEMTPYPK
jgi:hypothetical protein